MSEPGLDRERRPPPRIPGYRLEGVLGSGATGVVYRATQLSIDRVVALKVLHPEAVKSARAVRRLQREARTAARLKHPNIISAVDMGRTGDVWWFAMELVEGDSLAERLERGGRQSERKTLSIFIPLCDALQHASEHGVVHRDVKPANILLEGDGRPRLVDLGLARVEDDPLLTRTGATLGTPHYISPEQARDPVSADVRSDIWSLGASMYHCVCGRPPFTGTSAAEILSAVLYGSIPDPRRLRPELSRGLALVLRKCLSRDPERRYFTPAELRADLERVREKKAPSVKVGHLEPLDPRARRASRSRRQAGAVLALVALVAAALVVARPWSRDAVDDPPESAPRWAELETVQAALADGTIVLATAWWERERLCAAPPAGFEDDCVALRSALIGRLDAALARVYGELAARVTADVEARAWDAAERLLDGEVDGVVVEATGFAVAELPARRAVAFEARLEELREDVRRSREQAFERLATKARGQLELDRGVVARLVATGDFAGARALLERTPREAVAAAGADASGFSEARIGEGLGDVWREYERRLLELQREWRAVDQELVDWVEARADELRQDLVAERRRLAGELYRREMEQRLARRGLSLDALPAGFEARFPSRFEQRAEELARLEDELVEAAAAERLAELDATAAPLLAGRRYEDALALWLEHEREDVLRVATRTVELRREEARALDAFLRAAAEGLAARDGQAESLRVGSLDQTGALRVGREPLADGFELLYATGRAGRFHLRTPRGGAGSDNVLDARDLERFAVAGSAGVEAAELALRRALFRFAEGEYEAARELLVESGLDDGDYLVFDLRQRLIRALHEQADARDAKRAEARGIYESVTGSPLEGDVKRRLRRVDELLREYGDVLDERQLRVLREMRVELRRDPAPPTVEDFERVFGVPARGVGADAVELRYAFQASEVGTWRRNGWVFDGRGWIRGSRVESLEQLVVDPVPTLDLRPPFVVDRGTVALSLQLEQPEDSPHDLLVVSLCGFHAALSRGVDGGPPTAAIGTAGVEQAIGDARAGKGQPFAGLAAGAPHELTLEVNPARGVAAVVVDGVRLEAGIVPPPDRSRSVALRSLEPVRLLSASVRGQR